MTMSDLKHISMDYGINEKKFDEILDLGAKIREVRDFFDGKVLVDLVSDGFKIIINTNENYLSDILNKYFSEIGVPSFVESGSDYKFVNWVLRDYNKKLKRKFFGLLAGKHVVDFNKL